MDSLIFFRCHKLLINTYHPRLEILRKSAEQRMKVVNSGRLNIVFSQGGFQGAFNSK